LGGNFLSDDCIVTVNAILLDSVRKYTLNSVAVVLRSDLRNSFSDFLVSALVANDALCSLKCVISSENNVSFSTINFAVSNNYSYSCVRCVSIDVSTTDNLCNITFFQ
jgi:hypothetical protein